MAFRNVYIKDRCKLEYSLNYLICRKGIEETKVLLDEIKTIIIDSTQVSITTSLVSKLIDKKIKVIFCNELHNPSCELTPYQNNYYSYRKIKEQIDFDKNTKDFLWKRIVEEKIYQQARNLKLNKIIDKYEMLIDYKNNVLPGDITNREGHAAKVYFNALFGNEFNRKTDNLTNKYLNYGYSILLSSINREIKCFGYLTELGIHHIGESNPFNLSCDFIEPLRPLVDKMVILDKVSEENYRIEFIKMLSFEVNYDDKIILLDNAIHLYVLNLFEFLKTGDFLNIKFIDYEL